MGKRNTRIKDIANAAGVSVGTVDRVLHNRGKVSEIALKRVTEVLEKTDYRPNLFARMLGSYRSYKIAIMLPNPAQDPYWGMVHQGVIQGESEWVNFGVQVVTCPFDMLKKKSFEEAAKMVLDMNPDAALIAPIFYHETLPFFEQCLRRDIPYVLFNTNIQESKCLSFIGQDLYKSGRVAAELSCIGQKEGGKFAVLHVDEDLNDSVHLLEKEKGFKDYVQGMFQDRAQIESLNRTSSTDFSFKKKLAKLLAEPELRGIFASSSQGTATAASFLKSHGKNGIRLVGYDLLNKNVEYLRSGVIDFLIHQKPQQQAFLGISSLANYLVYKKRPSKVNLFPLEVITSQNLETYLSESMEEKKILETKTHT